MKIAPIPENEIKRLETLNQYKILDTPNEKDYDDIVKLASEICNTPISLISLIDMRRQWFKANIGLDDAETSRDIAFCSHAILDDDVMVVEDAWLDDRFSDNPLVTDSPNIRFYAGMPLVTPGGYKLGTLCVIDQTPKSLTDFQKQALKILSNQVVTNLEKRLKVNELNDALLKINEQHQKLEDLYNSNNRMLSIIGHDLRAPLSTLKTMLDMFGEGYLSADDTREMSLKLSESLKTTNELIDNLMFWARRQFDRQEMEFNSFDLSATVKSCFDLIRESAIIKKNQLLNNIPTGTEIVSEKNIINFILRNLISNSNKFTDNGIIEVSLDKTGGNNIIEIRDTGIGIQEDKLDKLFEWNPKMSTYGTAGEKGSGLGLSMSYEFVHKMYGDIEVFSKTGKGSEFRIIIPDNS